MTRFKNQPFALLGVNSDPDRDYIKKVIPDQQITWRSWWNGPEGTRGPIAVQWRVRGWPSLYILDSKGVIRFVPDQFEGDPEVLDRTIQKLLDELHQ